MLRRAIILLLAIGLCHADEKSSARIVVIGAGPSGIAAASKLLQNGFENVVILEAEDRIGGRIFTTEFDGTLVDLGGQWVHGAKGNVAYDLAKPLGLIEEDNKQYDYYDMYASPGNMLNTSVANDLINILTNSLETQEMIVEKHDESIGEYLTRKYNEYFAQHPEIDEGMRKKILAHYDNMVSIFDAAESWNDVTAVGDSEYIDCDGDKAINWKDRGYSTILDILMKKIPNPEEELPVRNKTILNTAVTKVDYSGEQAPVKLTTADGKEYMADHVIMTPSLGVLKAQYESLFDPPLPESKIQHIKFLGFGTVTKIFLAFNESWWHGMEMSKGGFSFLWDDSERAKYENDPKKSWILDAVIYSFVEHRPRLLLLWIGGKGARKVDYLTDEEVYSESVGVLRRFLEGEYNVTEPTGMIRSRWYANEHFRGTYSYRSPETDRHNASARGLAEPLVNSGKPVILFGGEATSWHHFGTVHGAIETGWREADRLIALYGESKPEAK